MNRNYKKLETFNVNVRVKETMMYVAIKGNP